MTDVIKRLMVSAFKNRLSQGMSWDQIRKTYPKMTDDEFNEIKTVIENE